MNNRIEAAYEQRPRRWVFELAVACLLYTSPLVHQLSCQGHSWVAMYGRDKR